MLICTRLNKLLSWNISFPHGTSHSFAANPGIVINQGVPENIWSQALFPSYIAVQKEEVRNRLLKFNHYSSIEDLVKLRDSLSIYATNDPPSLPSEIGFELNRWNNDASQFDFGYTMFYMSHHGISLPWLVSNMEAAVQDAFGDGFLMSNVSFRSLPSTGMENVATTFDFAPTLVVYALFNLLSIYVTHLVREREQGQKQLLVLAGLDTRAYYLAAFVRDFLVYLLLISVFPIGVNIKAIPVFVESSPASYLLLLLMTGPPFILLGYLLSSMFTKSTSVLTKMQFLFIAMSVPDVGVQYALEGGVGLPTACVMGFFLPTSALKSGLIELRLAYTRGVPYSTLMVFDPQYSMLPILLTLASSTLFYGFLAIHLDYAGNVWLSLKRLFTRGKSSTLLHDETETGVEIEDDEVINVNHSETSTSTDTMQIQGLTKEFPLQYSRKRQVVVDDLWLSLGRNECLGYLGPNGAGKTTTIEMLVGLLRPTSGNATIEGYPIVPHSPELKQLMGVCQQSDILFPELTGREHLRLFAGLRGCSTIEEAVEASIESMHLQEVADRRVDGYSGGNQRRLSIGMAVVGAPGILFLDEPTAGIDVHVRQSIWKTIRELKKTTSIILTTHSMEEADALCDRIAIIVNGHLAALGTPQRLKSVYGQGYKVTVRTRTIDTVESLIQQISKQFGKRHEQVRVKHRLGSNVEFEIEGSTPGKIFRFLQENQTSLDIVDHAVTQTTLAQVFIEFAKQQGIDL